MDHQYFAGFFDGEGSIMLTLTQYKSGKNNYQLVVVVVNTNREVLDKFKERFNGQVSLLTKNSRPNCKPAFRWRVVSLQALAFLQIIEPFLLVKKEQAKLALEFQARLHWNPKYGYSKVSDNEHSVRNSMLLRMKGLNARGVN